MPNKYKNISIKKPIKRVGLGLPLILTAACNAGGALYYSGGADVILVSETVVFNPAPVGFIETSYNVFVASDDSNHILDFEFYNEAIDVTAMGGDDIIDTGNGNDFVDGGAGYDIIRSHAGSDIVYGGAGLDHISGGSGNDELYGESGDDWLFGNDGNDIISGGSGNDRIWGDAGVDALYGDSGDDVFEMYGSDLSDLEDFFDGGSGYDTLLFYNDDPVNPLLVDLALINAINIEIIDLNDVENEIDLDLTVADVIEVTDAFNELFIDGDSGDTVLSAGQGWLQQADDGNYHVYTAGAATLLIDTEIVQEIT